MARLAPIVDVGILELRKAAYPHVCIKDPIHGNTGSLGLCFGLDKSIPWTGCSITYLKCPAYY